MLCGLTINKLSENRRITLWLTWMLENHIDLYKKFVSLMKNILVLSENN